MSNPSPIIRQISRFVIFAVPLFHLAVVAWVLLGNYLPFAIHLAVSKILIIFMVCSYLFFFPALLLVGQKTAYKIIFLAATLPVCTIATLLYLSRYTEIKTSTSAQGDIFHHVAQHNFLDYSYVQHYLYKCNSYDLNCISFYIDSNANWNAAFYVDENTNEVYLFETIWFGILRYSFHGNEIIKDYDPLETVGLGKYNYTLVQYKNAGVSVYKIFQCVTKTGSDCKVLPFQYTTTENHIESKLITEESKQEINMIIGNQVIYTFGSKPYCYVKGCIITGK